MSVELATGYVSILPSAAGFGPRLASELAGIGVTVGAGLGDDVALGLVDGLKRNGARVANAGKALTLGVTVPLAAIGVAAVSAEADFSKSMNLLQAATGAPADKMSDLRNLAKRLGQDTVFSAGEAARAMLELAKGGMTTAQIKAGGVQAAMTLAAAGEMEMADAATITMAAMNTFNIEAKRAGEVTDALAGAANSSAADVDDLAQGLAMAGQAAASSGLSVQETAAALAAFSNAGLSGSDAGTSFKTMLVNLNPKSKEASELMAQLGMDFFDAQGNMKPLTGIAAQLQSGFKGLSVEERNAAMQTIFGTDASRAANILRKEGVKGITDLIDATSEQGAAQKMADAAMSGTAGALEQLKGSLETAALAIGEALAPVVQDLAGKIRGLADWFTNLNPGVQETIVKIGLAAAATGPLLFVFGKLTQSLGVIIGFVTSAPAKWLAMKAAMVVVKVATVAWTAAQWLLNAALNANPIGAVIIVIAALAAAIIWLWNNNEGFRNFVIAAWEKIQEVVATVVDWFKANVAPVLASVWQKVSKALGVLWDVYRTVYGKILSVVWDFVQWLAEKAWPVIQWVWEKVSTHVQIMAAIVSGVWDSLSKVIGPVVKWLADNVMPKVVAAWQLVSKNAQAMQILLEKVWDIIGGVIDTVVTAIQGNIVTQFRAIKAFFDVTWELIGRAVTTAWNAISTTVSTAVAAIKTVIATIGAVVSTVVGFFTSIKDGIEQKFTTAVAFIAGIPDKIVAALGDVGNTLTTKGRNLIQGLYEGWIDKWATVKDWVTGLPGLVVDKVGDTARKLFGAGKDIIQGFRDGWSDKWENVKTWLSEMPGKAVAAVGSLLKTLYAAGVNLLTGFLSGISAKWEEVKRFVGGLAGWLQEHKGPRAYDLALLRPAGQWIMQGLSDGLMDGLPGVEDTLSKVAATIAATDATLTPSITATATGVAGYRPSTTATISPYAYGGAGTTNTFAITAAPTIPTEQQIVTALARYEALQPA